jgi:hypothetical protein
VLRTLVHANLITIHNVLRTLVNTSPPHIMAQARDIINELATAMHAMQTTVVTNVGSNFRFSCLCLRYVLKVPLITDWQAIMHACEYQQNDNLQCANRKQCQND